MFTRKTAKAAAAVVVSHRAGTLARVLLPPVCPVCGAVGSAPCPACVAQLRPSPALPPPPGVDWCSVLFAYEGVGREVVARLKYRNARSALPWLADGMAGLVVNAGRVPDLDVVTWAPTSGTRRRERGFDHGRLLAEGVARRLGLPCPALLRRLPGPPQTGAGRRDRLAAPRFAMRRVPAPARALLVDDVVTTGATLSAAARALRGAGATSVGAVAVGRRPYTKDQWRA